MATDPMDPHYEQILRDEVTYLHSLWHRGPPRPAPAAPVPAPAPAPAPDSLRPSSTTQFKKEKKPRRRRGRKNKQKLKSTNPESKPSAGTEWPCASPPAPTADWVPFETPSNQTPNLISPEAQEIFWAKQAHQKALGAVTEFIRSKYIDDDGDVIDSSDGDDDLMGDDDGPVGYSFFVKLYMEDVELREYYKKNYANGEFICLVCGAVGGKKTCKRFKNCVALVQHSITVARIKKHAHRAYSQAICKILGWDINRLPSIVSSLADKSVEVQGNLNNGDNSSIVLVNNGEIVPGGSIAPEPFPDEGQQNMNSLTSPNANEKEELGKVVADKVDEPVKDLCKVIAGNADEPVEDLDWVVANNVDKPAEGATEELLKENSVVENELEDSQKDSAVLDESKEDNILS
ncbi:Hypothetical predicted protein [Olea europaea subsp. europaea]|uniref:Uncharacterized protein n=1 Tax=Olea europaea subsp. europaea TaxID=158383 RepID=A0A8S0T4B1_OLEEU|nr:Hypothetical predicted protein [Olea europaea subsp. europaea]